MILERIVAAMQLKVQSGRDELQREVRGGYVGDLLSDVMANAGEGDLWITRQVHQNIVAVASLKDLAGIVLVKDIEPAEDTLAKAVREKIPLLQADLTAFEAAGRLYALLESDRS